MSIVAFLQIPSAVFLGSCVITRASSKVTDKLDTPANLNWPTVMSSHWALVGSVPWPANSPVCPPLCTEQVLKYFSFCSHCACVIWNHLSSVMEYVCDTSHIQLWLFQPPAAAAEPFSSSSG